MHTQSTEDVTTFYCRANIFKYSNFPSAILEWNNLDMKIGKTNFLMSFKNSSLRVGRPTAMPMYGVHNAIGLKFLTRLRLDLSHLNEHKFKHNFKDCVNHLCSFSILFPEIVRSRARVGTHTSKFTCAIYRMRKIIVFSRKEKFFIERFSIEHN